MRVLVAGAAGMLGQDVIGAGRRAGHEMLGYGHEQLDITDAGSIAAALERAAPEALVNCAASIDVDGAESDPVRAFAINADGAGLLARAAPHAGGQLLHISSDYVFDGRAPRARSGAPRGYVESDPTGPVSTYGESKLAGERQVLEASPRHLVVRSAWLFGVAGGNFVATMLALAHDRAAEGAPCAVDVVTDQVGSPTWTGHLAPAMVGLLERGVTGVVHLAGSGWVSWHGLAVETFRQAEVACEVREASTAQMRRPAPRPAFSALESERDDVLPLPPWQDGLAGYLAARAGMIRR